ncbi:MAG: MCE family protein [Solirubrobacterales bacterium]|nr:MCE family protein [Solirubrobacterales bacterium]
MKSPFKRQPRARRVSRPIPYALALIALVVIGSYLAVTKDIPYLNDPFTIQAAFKDTNGMKTGSPVRIAGVNVGEVTEVKPTNPGARSAVITMSINDAGRPIKTDATMKIRPRIFLEGNFFIEVSPGRPGTKELAEGGMVDSDQTSNPVQFDQVLLALKSDVRSDLRSTFAELLGTDANGGGKAFNRSLDFQPAAYRFSAIVSEALLGEKEGDLRRFLGNQATVYAALDSDPAALQGLITNFNTTTAALADREADLRAALRELPVTLRTALPTLTSLNAAFPPVRRFASAALPGVRSTGPTVDAVLPLVTQLRGLVSRSELRGLSQDLRAATPPLARFARTTVPLLGELRTLASCVSTTLVPYGNQTLEDPNFPATGRVFEEFPKSLVGLAGESRSSDANGQFFKVLGQGGLETVSLGNGLLGAATRPMEGVNPPPQKSVPPLQPDAPCENQELPDLRTIPGAPPPQTRVNPNDPKVVARTKKATQVAAALKQAQLIQSGDKKTKVLDTPATLEQLQQSVKALASGGKSK